jgi:stage V sporulation protein S
MNRFFSKLDLRDIKIDPRTSRFLPDAEEETTEETEPESNHQPVAAETHLNGEVADAPAAPSERPRYVPSWATPPPPAAVEPVSAPATAAATIPTTEDADGLGEGGGDVTVHRTEEGQVEVLKVSARSRPSAVAGAIAGVVRENGRAEVQAIGAGATNQAVKAVAIARDYLRETGIEAICLPAFIDVTIENEDRTAIRLVVEPR